MRAPQITLYAKQAGVEIAPYEKRSEGRPAEGRVALRFFRFEGGEKALRFVVEPAEAFELYVRMRKVYTEGGKETVSHSFATAEGEVQSRLTLERYNRGGKSGFALALHRGSEEINVPLSAERFLYAAEFLHHLALSEAWVEVSLQKG